ncbi:MAG: hypothetical protein IJE84_05225 [Clostridia bacterium]|nr:hypothetical protein [Clostridia bacterium]
MNATEFFTEGGSVSDTNAIRTEPSLLQKSTNTLNTVNDLLLELRDSALKECPTAVQIYLSKSEKLDGTFTFNGEQALALLREVCTLTARKGDTMYIDVYEKDAHIFYSFCTSASAEDLTDIWEDLTIRALAESCKALISCEEDSTGRRTLTVSFGHADIGTLGFKTDGTKKFLPRW